MRWRKRAGPPLAAALFGFFLHAPAGAQESAWQQDGHASLRLIGSGAPLAAAIEIRLDAGWKTYWRYPGDSGVPAKFDFAGSDNVASVAVLWPAPRRFPDGAGGHSIGYTQGVTLPLAITPRDARRPVTLHLSADYAICANICVPVRAQAELTIGAERTALADAIAAARVSVPEPTPPGSAAPLAVVSAALKPETRNIVIDTSVPPGASDVELLAEGPDSAWALPLPVALPPDPATPDRRRFTLAIDGMPPGADIATADLVLTLRAGDRAIETCIRPR